MICGIDEAGRGPVAGPLVVAGAILHTPVEGLTDSKKLTPKKREQLFDTIIDNCDYEIVTTHNDTIDAIGLSKAIVSSLCQIMEKLDAKRYIFDGNSSFGVCGLETMIKGDLKEQNISAASVLAKVTRDRYMESIAKRYPQYDFKGHKGYITKKHIAEIEAHGYSDVHRKSVVIKSLRQKSLF